MSPWTKVIDGEKQDERSPLLPDGDAPPQDFHDSAAASSPPVDGYPDPVKPSDDSQSISSSGYPAIGMVPPPVYAPGDSAMGHPALPQATAPPAPGQTQLVINERGVVQQPMKGSQVVVCCPQCGHTGPARVSKESGFLTFFSSGMLCFLGCPYLFFLPFCCSDCCKDWVYSCSTCGTVFGHERP